MNPFCYIKNRTKLFRKRIWHRTKIFWKYYFKTHEKNPIFVISTYRSGSNLLLSYLNSIPHCSFAAEILNPDMYYGLRTRHISKKSVLDHIKYSIQNCPEDACGAKLHMDQMDVHHVTAADLLGIFPKAKFIVLYRESMFDQYVSLQIAKTTKHWCWHPSFSLPKEVFVDIPSFQKMANQTKTYYHEVLEDLSSCPNTFVFSYEQLIDHPEEVFNENFFSFLEIPRSPVFSSLKKQNTKDLKEIVKNYKEIEWILEHPGFRQNYFSLDKRFFAENGLAVSA